jgi:1-phosphofructokinase family hexose kinase
MTGASGAAPVPDADWTPTGRLLCVSLAASLDRYARLPAVRIGAINRPRAVEVRAGGKGLNVARAAVGMGVPTRSVALAGGETGRTVRALAAAEGLAVTWVDGDAETRQCLCLLDESTGTLTEVYEPVQPVAADRWPGVRAAVADEVSHLTGRDLVVLSGRVPPGLPVDALAQLVDVGTAAGVPVLVDSDGDALAASLPRRPTLVKINQHEAAAVAGSTAEVADVWTLAEAIQRAGARDVVVTCGPSGSVYLGADGRRLLVEHPPIERALPVGSGDAFLAGLSAAWLSAAPTYPDGMALALAVAAGAARANARNLVACDISWSDVRAELPAIRVSPP